MWTALLTFLLRIGMIVGVVYVLKSGLAQIKPFVPAGAFDGIVTLLVGVMFWIAICSSEGRS